MLKWETLSKIGLRCLYADGLWLVLREFSGGWVKLAKCLVEFADYMGCNDREENAGRPLALAAVAGDVRALRS